MNRRAHVRSQLSGMAADCRLTQADDRLVSGIEASPSIAAADEAAGMPQAEGRLHRAGGTQVLELQVSALRSTMHADVTCLASTKPAQGRGFAHAVHPHCHARFLGKQHP